MPPPPRCPVCGKRKDAWKHHGYSLPPRDQFTLPTNPAWATPANNHICRQCWLKHQANTAAPPPASPPHSSPLDVLASVLFSSPSLSPSRSSLLPSPSFLPPSSSLSSTPPPPPSPLLPHSPLTLLPAHHLHPPTYSASAPLPLKDITNTLIRTPPPPLAKGKKRRLTPTLGEKARVVRALSDVPRGRRREVMRALGVNSSALYHYKQSIDNNRAKPPSEQRPLTACRTSGGGRKSKLTPEQEAEVKRHILSIRRSPARPRVTRVMVQLYVQEQYGVELGRKGIANLLRRQRLSDRKRTTTKEVNTPRMQEIKRHWTNKFASFFATTNHQWIINIDETSVYRDAPGDSTIDEIGAKTVEIGSTQHDADRVAVLLCINRAGTVFTPLIIHKSTSRKKVLQFIPTSVRIERGGKDIDVKMWVSYAPKGWLNGAMMVKWLQVVYMAELASKGIGVEDAVLFMDNCPAHECDEVVATMRGGAIKYEFFPPKCTPILQPLDQNVNQLFGLEYAKKYEEWYMTKGAYDFTPAGNLRRATDDEVNKWIAHALVAITPHIVRVSWERATSAPLHVMRLPAKPWEKIMSFLPPGRRAC